MQYRIDGLICSYKRRITPRRPVLVRYADDFVILCKTYEGASRALINARDFLKTRGLEFKNSADPDIVHITQGFDLLGCTFKRVPNYGYLKHSAIRLPLIQEGTLISKPWYSEKVINDLKQTIVLVKPSNTLISRFKANIKTAALATRGTNVGVLIRMLNTKIRGFALSMQTVNCTQTFREIDNSIFTRVVRFLRRLHHKKSWGWIKSRYFIEFSSYRINSTWILHDPETKIRLIPLRNFTKIDHVLIKGDACVDDPSPQMVEYFYSLAEKRFDKKQINLLNSLDRDLSQSQNHLCPVCVENLHTTEYQEKLHRHHIKARSVGGLDTFSNLVIVHSQCHDRVHYGTNHEAWYKKLSLYKKYLPWVPHPSAQKPRKSPTKVGIVFSSEY